MNKDLYFKYEWKYKKEDLKFCPRCGHRLSLEDLHIPNQPQLLCHHCHFIFYLDPKLAVTAVVFNKNKNKVLLLQRNEDPGKGLWAFPGGYVERGQDPFETIKNEVREETGLVVEVGEIIGTFSFPEDGLIQLAYEAIADREEVHVNLESKKGRFFAFDEIPWDELAFSTTEELLCSYVKKANLEIGTRVGQPFLRNT
ncbi:ADP-ribose pyrophosphatase YjhB, NUDIX family [Planifilum fulgidum]|uniref:ADP-ribose pyrophosphatase YjhB, NUDIX family n=1 Tax=Planifilum fulgidum TaxID=201973 RepID=A0A1I2KB51_9BACL|nr:NUDIX hydrolase [Planifilum fulgidum]SFF63440.1 ADP-ribose pyrophosphatase YjhB, NUDIX family [Planifilum fulgidum]